MGRSSREASSRPGQEEGCVGLSVTRALSLVLLDGVTPGPGHETFIGKRSTAGVCLPGSVQQVQWGGVGDAGLCCHFVLGPILVRKLLPVFWMAQDGEVMVAHWT